MKRIFRKTLLTILASTSMYLLTENAEAEQIGRKETADENIHDFVVTAMNNPAYLLFYRDDVKSCSINIVVRDPRGRKTDNRSCTELYTLAKPQGDHEFIIRAAEMMISLNAPPGGIMKKDGTHWAITGAIMDSIDRSHAPVSWRTQGLCIYDDNKSMICRIDDGKVGINISLKIGKHNILKE